MAIDFKEIIELLNDNKSVLSDDARALTDILRNADKLSRNYRKILDSQRLSEREVKETLKILSNLADILAENLEGLLGRNFTDIFQGITQTLFNTKQAGSARKGNHVTGGNLPDGLAGISFLGQFLGGSFGGNFAASANAGNNFTLSNGQLMSDLSRILQKSIRDL